MWLQLGLMRQRSRQSVSQNPKSSYDTFQGVCEGHPRQTTEIARMIAKNLSSLITGCSASRVKSERAYLMSALKLNKLDEQK